MCRTDEDLPFTIIPPEVGRPLNGHVKRLSNNRPGMLAPEKNSPAPVRSACALCGSDTGTNQ